jgi:hypothetical protein
MSSQAMCSVLMLAVLVLMTSQPSAAVDRAELLAVAPPQCGWVAALSRLLLVVEVEAVMPILQAAVEEILSDSKLAPSISASTNTTATEEEEHKCLVAWAITPANPCPADTPRPGVAAAVAATSGEVPAPEAPPVVEVEADLHLLTKK